MTTASQSQRSASSWRGHRRETRSVRASTSASPAPPSGDQQRPGHREGDRRARGLQATARPRARGLGRLHTASPSPDVRRTSPRRTPQVGYARKPGSSGSSAWRRRAAAGSVAAAVQCERDLTAQQVHLGALELVQRSGLCDGNQSECRVERAGLVLGLGRGERAPRPGPRVGRQRGGTLQERGRGRQPTARLCATRRALELKGNVLVEPRRRLGKMPGAAIGIDRRVSRVRQRAMHRLPVLPARRRDTPPSGPTGDERHPRANREQAVGVGRRLDPDPEPPGCPPHQHRIANGLRRRHQQQPPGIRRERRKPAAEAVLDPPRQRKRVRNPNPPASSAGVNPRGSSNNANGFPRVSATSRSRTRSSNGTRTAEPNSARASPSRRPSTASFGNPSSSSPASRVTNTSATDSANKRRATNTSACAEARSSHCASSTTHTSGCSSAASESKLRTANPTRNRSGAFPTPSPNATPSAFCCGAGSRSRRSSIGAHNCCKAANASSISDSIPTALEIRNPDAESIADSSSAVLPTPGSPHTTSTRLCPPRTAASSRSSASRSLRRPCNTSAGPSVTMQKRPYRAQGLLPNTR